MSEVLNMEQTILESATELFLKKGFKATFTTEIAKEAGCNQALVHYYFRTKDRLFEAIFQEMVKFFVGALHDIGKEEPPFMEKLEKKSSPILRPLKYIIEVLRRVYLKGSAFNDLLPQFWALCGFTLFFNGWAVLRYRKNS